ALGGFNQRAPIIAVLLGIGFNLFDDQTLERRGVIQQLLQFLLLIPLLGQLFLDLEAFQPGQLTQAHLKDVFSLTFRQVKAFHQCLTRLVGFAYGLDHLIDIQVDHHSSFEDMNAVGDFIQSESGAPRYRLGAEAEPLGKDAPQWPLGRTRIGSNADQIDRNAALHAGLRQQKIDELVTVDATGLGLEHQTHGVFLAGLVPNGVQHAQYKCLRLLLFGGKAFLAGLDLGIGAVFDFLENLLRRGARWQLIDHKLPLSASHLLEAPARPGLDRATTGLIDLGDVFRRRNNLPATG